MSRRKLAFTLGMKAATGDVCITTTSNCGIPSPCWLKCMAEPFATSPATDICLGATMQDFSEMKGAWRWYREFDTVCSTAFWIAAARAGRPFRGDGYNLAMRRSLFFRNKGYARTIYLQTGDDDLFLTEVADGGNTRTMVTPATTLSTRWGESSLRVWADRKEQYDFTSRWLPKRSFRAAGFLSAAQWGVLLLCGGSVALGYDGPHAPLTLLLSPALLLLMWTLDIMAYRRAASALGAVRLWWGVPLFMLWRPLGNALFRLRHRKVRFKNFTWQRR